MPSLRACVPSCLRAFLKKHTSHYIAKRSHFVPQVPAAARVTNNDPRWRFLVAQVIGSSILVACARISTAEKVIKIRKSFVAPNFLWPRGLSQKSRFMSARSWFLRRKRLKQFNRTFRTEPILQHWHLQNHWGRKKNREAILVL